MSVHPSALDGPRAALWLDARDPGRVLGLNPGAEGLFRRRSEALLAQGLAALCEPGSEQLTGQNQSLTRRLAQAAQAAPGEHLAFDWSFQDDQGREVHCEAELQPCDAGLPGVVLSLAEVDLPRRAEALRQGQADLLELIARGSPLADTLKRLTELIESQSTGLYCSVLLLQEDGVHIRNGAGPRLPAEYMAALDGYEIGPRAGSCGTAMFLRRMVIVSDIGTDPLWAPYKFLVEPHGLRACWSTPIFLGDGAVLGSFAMYYQEIRSPQPAELRLMEVARHLAGIAIERERRERALHRYEQELEALVAERTQALAQAKELAEQNLQALRLTQDELVRSQKLAALGAMVAGVAHELNTPIGNSLLAASSVVDEAGAFAAELASGPLKRSELRRYLERTQSNGALLLRNLQRAAAMVEKFKQVAVNHSETARERFRVADAVAEALAWLQSQRREGLRLTVQAEVPPELALDGFPRVLVQVLRELLGNALAHAFVGRSQGCITIRATPQGADALLLRLSDDGVGVPAAQRENVFDPFFSTRFGQGGSGLGLSLAHTLVSDVLGGRIALAEAAGPGCVFELQLPLRAP